MRKIFILGLLGLAVSCADDEEQNYKISGTVENAAEGQQIYVSELNETNTQAITIDTIPVENGKFEVDLPEKETPTISFLTMEGVRGNVLYIADNTPINFKIYRDSLHASTVTGGEDNEILYSYLGKIRKTNEKMSKSRNEARTALMSNDTSSLKTLKQDQQKIADEDMANKKSVVQENPNSLVSVMVLQDMVNTGAFTGKELKELYESLSPAVKATSLAQLLEQNLLKLSKTDIGSKAPEISAPTPEGNNLALNEALGKVTLVDFWASWCKPCRVENPNIVNVYNKFHEKGFNIVQVSLDRPGQKDKWIEAIEKDNLGQWNHVSNLMFWQDPIAAEYGVQAIPAAFLLDGNGNIVAKDLRGPELEQKVAELLEE